MRTLVIFIGIFFLYLTGISLYTISEELKVYKNGEKTKMKIVYIPNSCLGTKIKWKMKVQFDDKVFTKQIPGSYCNEHRLNEVIDMVYHRSSAIVLFPNENPYSNFIPCAFFFLIGFSVIFWYGILRKPLYYFKSKRGGEKVKL